MGRRWVRHGELVGRVWRGVDVVAVLGFECGVELLMRSLRLWLGGELLKAGETFVLLCDWQREHR
jgi:hypothetical protein